MKIIAVIGAGNMGEAIIKGLSKTKIIVSDKKKNRLKRIKKKIKINIVSNNTEAVKKADIIVLAVKPQDIEAVLNEIKGVVNTKKIIISIAAGIKTGKIEKSLSDKIPVVRVMPNMPALVGMGISVLCAGKYAKNKHMQIAKKIFVGMGKVLEVKKESLMDAVTATSGSGPAYIYLFIESLIDSSKKLGLNKTVAKELVLQTLRGAIELLDKTRQDPAKLRRQVTSPGGTTETALKVFKNEGFQRMILSAVKAASKRSKELSR